MLIAVIVFIIITDGSGSGFEGIVGIKAILDSLEKDIDEAIE